VVEDLPQFAQVTDDKTQVMDVLKDSPADKAGFVSGDTLLSIDGQPITGVEGVRDYTRTHEGQPITVVFKHDDKTLTQNVTPVRLEGAEQAAMGIALVRTGMVSYPFWYAPVQGAVATWVMGREIVLSFGSLIGDLVVKHKVSVDLSGPIGIAVITSQVAARGIRYLIQFTALLSLNLAIINILPFPALDGGRVLFLAIEKIRGKAVGRKIEIVAHNLGFALLMLLVLLVTIGDVRKFGGGMVQGLSRFFTGG
jgi:regulator of sigma E protease